MDEREAGEQVRRLTEEWVQQQQLAESSTRQATALSKIIKGYIEMYPELDDLVEDYVLDFSFDRDNAPRGAEAVRLILQDAPNEWLYVSELVERLKARDWLPESDNPANAVRTALERLVANSAETDIVKHHHSGKVVYGYMPDRAASPPPSAGGGYDEEPL